MAEKPNKGWIKEIAKRPVNENKKDSFTWHKALVKPTASAMNTPRRIANNRSVKPAKTTIGDEFKELQAKRGRQTWK